MEDTFIPLHVLSGRLELPKAYLKRLADAKRIPFVVVAGNRRRYNQTDVCDAIRKLTAQRRRQLLGGMTP